MVMDSQNEEVQPWGEVGIPEGPTASSPPAFSCKPPILTAQDPRQHAGLVSRPHSQTLPPAT